MQQSDSDSAPVKVGVLGGGQLGRMMAEAASPLGNTQLQVHCLDPAVDAPASFALPNSQFCCGQFNSKDPNNSDIVQFVKKHQIQVLTTEIEHVDCESIRLLASTVPGLVIEPSVDTLALIQDKYVQKCHLSKALASSSATSGKATVPMVDFREIVAVNGDQVVDKPVSEKLRALYLAVQDAAENKEHGLGYPMMLKRKRLAYDGRGNAVVRSREDIPKAVESLLGAELTTTTSPGNWMNISKALYAEKWATFKKELAVMVARSRTGQLAAYPVVETIQKDSICHLVIAPAQISPRAYKEATDVALRVVDRFPGAGIYGVELFLLGDDHIVFNEIAPRPHNSGHYTIEACETSQFEQHLRAVAGLPLGSCAMKVPASIMLNILGTGSFRETWAPVKQALSVFGATVHWYDKSKCNRGRKMGHITVVGNSLTDCMRKINKISPDTLQNQIEARPIVGIIMGSDSDLPTMRPCAEILDQFGVPFELTIVSAHRTPDRLMDYARSARGRGIRVIVAGAGGAAHLPGMVAAMTPLPVIGVPVKLKSLDGVDSLYSIVQMPRGVPVACVAIDNATNAGLLAVRMLGIQNEQYLDKMSAYQDDMRNTVLAKVEKINRDGWSNYSA